MICNFHTRQGQLWCHESSSDTDSKQLSLGVAKDRARGPHVVHPS